MSEATPRIPTPGGRSTFGTPLDDAVTGFAATAMRATSVDPLITELVRLRCAQVHDCRLCGSLRTADVTEGIVAKIAHYETSDLDDAAKAALRLADAMMLLPGDAGDELRAQLHEHFTDEQIAELCFDVVKWSQQKLFVALRLETPPWDGLARLSWSDDGDPEFGASLDEVSALG